MADEDLFRYLLALTQIVGVGVLIYYAIIGWRFLRTMDEDDEINYQSKELRPNIWKLPR